MKTSDLEALKIKEKDRHERHIGSRKTKIVLFLISLLILIISVFVVKFLITVKEVETIQVSISQSRMVTPILTAGGYVIPKINVIVSAMLSTRVKEIYVDEGDVVEKGEIIARLESNEFEAQLRQAEANLMVAKASLLEAKANLADAQLNLSRCKELFKEGAVSQNQLDSAQIKYDIAKASYSSAEAQISQAEASLEYIKIQLADTIVYAPISGCVTRRLVEVGELLLPRVGPSGFPASTIVMLADLSEIKVEVDINEIDIRLVKLDQKVMIIPDSAPDISYEGMVVEISPVANRQKSIIQVKILIIEPDSLLKPDMSVKVNFFEEHPKKADEEKTILIPKRAVVNSEENKKNIFIVKDEKAYIRMVKTGRTVREEIEITNGLKGDEEIIVRGHELLRDEDKVRVKE